MTNPTPYLELRPTGYFWRRRVPVAMSSRYSNPFFCFPLKTDLLREAAAVAGRITAISDICFRAEIAVPPDVMTRLLVTYARLEIETADRIRALTGPRSRAAADASLAVEAAIRASLRDAILRCERDGRLQAGHVNDPELDARLVFEVLANQIEALKAQPSDLLLA